MSAVQSEVAGDVAGQVAGLLAPVLAGADGRMTVESAGPQVNHLWSLLSGYPKIQSIARHPDDDLEEDLTREIGLVLRDNRPLRARTSQLLAEVHGARTA